MITNFHHKPWNHYIKLKIVQMYFQYEGVYISPYVQNGETKNSVFFRYDFCKLSPIPKYKSNYQRHCNLMSAVIVTLLIYFLIANLCVFYDKIL